MVYLVRHGETDWNLFKRCNGVTETFMNQTGIKQAQKQAEYLSDVHIDCCYCSSMIRARQFCNIIYSGNAVYDDRLVELDCGEFEGMEETKEMMDALWRAVQTGDRGVETLQDFVSRNYELCEEIAAKHKGQNVLIITHAANVPIIDYYFTGKPENYNFKKKVIGKGQLITYDN